MKVIETVMRNKIEIASENLFDEHVETKSTTVSDAVIVTLSLIALLVVWWLS